MTGFDFTRTATQTADTYYEKARNSANLALIVMTLPNSWVPTHAL